MADTEVTIKVTTETDIGDLNDLNSLLDDTQNKASETGEALQTAFQEATAEVEELTQTLADIEMGESDEDFDEISQKLEEATSRAEELGDALNNLDGSGLDDASSSADDLTGSLGNATDGANELSDSMGLIESSMLMGMADQIGAIGDEAEGTAQSLDQTAISVGQLATNTGIAEPQMRNLIAHISNVTFPQDEAIAYVNALNQMGVAGDKLGESATNMDRINDATGIGYQKVMQLTQGLQAVGISADNLPASFNAIAYAQANVNGGADTMATVLKRQASTINEYGLSVDQLVVIMQGLSAQGVQGMKMGSELSKLLKDNNGDLSAIEKQLGLTSGALSNANQITGEYDGTLQQLADEEMEHKTLTERLGAVYEDLALYLEPVLSPLMSFVGIIGSFGQTALAINSLLTLAETFGILKTATISQTMSNWWLAISEWAVASPILIIVALVLILIGVLAYLYFTNEDVRNAINGLGEAFMNFGQIAYQSVLNAVTWITNALQGLWDYIMTLGGLIPQTATITGNAVIDSVIKFLTFMVTLPLQLQVIFINAIAKALGFGDNFVQGLISAGSRAVSNFASQIRQIPTIVLNEFNRVLGMVNDFINSLPSRVWDMGQAIIDALKSSLGIHSPGIMYWTLRGEFERMEDLPSVMEGGVTANIGHYGKGITDAFNPDLTTDFNNTGVIELMNNGMTGQVNNFYFNDTVIDNDDRMQKIVDAVRKEIAWNNKTAGRTV